MAARAGRSVQAVGPADLSSTEIAAVVRNIPPWRSCRQLSTLEAAAGAAGWPCRPAFWCVRRVVPDHAISAAAGVRPAPWIAVAMVMAGPTGGALKLGLAVVTSIGVRESLGFARQLAAPWACRSWRAGVAALPAVGSSGALISGRATAVVSRTDSGPPIREQTRSSATMAPGFTPIPDHRSPAGYTVTGPEPVLTDARWRDLPVRQH